jgi:hypothetical protein
MYNLNTFCAPFDLKEIDEYMISKSGLVDSPILGDIRKAISAGPICDTNIIRNRSTGNST